jgi:hypothetical protein
MDMRFKWLLIVICAISVLILGNASAAATDFEFFPSKVYFTDDTTLIVEGNFYNRGSFISWLPKASVEITLNTDDGPQIIKRSFDNLELMLNHQGIRSWKFEIHDTSKVDFNSWKVKTRF